MVEVMSAPSTISTTTETSTPRTSSTNDTGLEFKMQDLAKDNVASPIDLECHIQCERITKMFDTSIQKIKICVVAPILVQDLRREKGVVADKDLSDLVDIFDQYDNPLFSESLLNMAAVEELKMGDDAMKNRMNPELAHMLYVLFRYPNVNERAELLIEQYLAAYKRDRSNADLMEFLILMEEFRNLMVTQMETSAAEQLASKILTRKLENSNKMLLEAIEAINDSLEQETKAFQETMAAKAEVINRLEQELSSLNNEATIKLKKKILDSERQMVLATRSHTVRNEVLKEEEIEMVESYKNQLQHHMQEEKNLRARRFKVETQLMSWLSKYDLEMADKQKEFDEFKDLYDGEDKLCKELEEKLAEQDKTFIPLMEEREKEYHAEMEEKMVKFVMDHAARVIQNAWKTVLANRSEKRKLRKIQKKMQLQQAAAERAAARAAAAAAKAAKAEKKKEKAAKKAAKAAERKAAKNQ